MRPGSEETFLQAYGADGMWMTLFRKGTGFVSTELVRDLARPRVYFTIDRWESEESYRKVREDYAAEYAAIDRSCEGLAEDEQKVAESVSV